MRKPRFYAALGLLALAGCTTNDEFFSPEQELAQQELNDNTIRFGTYLGKQGTTRAGATGLQATSDLQTNGFGVFAYYTGKDTYGQYMKDFYADGRRQTTGDEQKTNFMYNQRVYWDATGHTGEVGATGAGKWVYTPEKYWPNESSTSGSSPYSVDDQTTEKPTTKADYGGNVSFFAYAPYIYVTTSDVTGVDRGKEKVTSTTSGYEDVATGETQAGTKGVGITNISANNVNGDPIITYVVPTADNQGFIDLLWGTLDGTATTNVVDDATPGVTGTTADYYYAGDDMYDETHVNYVDAVLKGYKVNANLSKQKTTGTVGFKFKHALAILGGSFSNTDATNEDDAQWGFRVVLDNDDQKGSIFGGTKGDETVVTLKKITLHAESKLWIDADDDGEIDDGELHTVTSNTGRFNLATGRWNIDYISASPVKSFAPKSPSESAAVQEQVIQASNVTEVKYKMNPAIAETVNTDGVTSTVSGVKDGHLKNDATVDGVQNTPRNVYGEDTDPLVFFPGTVPVITVEVDYIVRTEDPNLDKGYSEVEQVIKKQITFTEVVDMNKKYDLLMHLGLTSVKFTASVEKWSGADDEEWNYDIDGDGDVDIKVEDIYLPKNVGAYTFNADAAEAVIADNDATCKFVLDGLTIGTEYTVTLPTSATMSKPELTTSKFTATGTTQEFNLASLGTNTGYTTISKDLKITGGTTTKEITIKQLPAPFVLTESAGAVTVSHRSSTYTSLTTSETVVRNADGVMESATTADATHFALSAGIITLPTASGTYTVTVTKNDATGTITVVK